MIRERTVFLGINGRGWYSVTVERRTWRFNRFKVFYPVEAA